MLVLRFDLFWLVHVTFSVSRFVMVFGARSDKEYEIVGAILDRHEVTSRQIDLDRRNTQFFH